MQTLLELPANLYSRTKSKSALNHFVLSPSQSPVHQQPHVRIELHDRRFLIGRNGEASRSIGEFNFFSAHARTGDGDSNFNR